jgi:BirA family biotin operon repressor/biotin-[acetyl-CoA-carboxylase] ligase
VPLTVADWSGLSLAVGVALCEAIETIRTPGSNAPRLGLKWPNDLWLGAPGEGGRKLGGLLIETVAAGSQRLAVIGVGINIEPFAADAVATGFACAQELDPEVTAPALMARVALPLVQAVHLFSEAGFGAFAARFAAHDLLVGKAVTTTSPELPEGVARGVSPHGALLLQTASGVHELSSGEISVRVAPGRAADIDHDGASTPGH